MRCFLNVEVTFDGKPAALTWVQDSQINVAVPWSVKPRVRGNNRA